MSKRFVMAAVAFVTTGVAVARWLQVGVSAPTAQVRVAEQSNQGVTFEVTVPGIEVSAEHRDGRDFSRVAFPGGHPAPLAAGQPEVPMLPVLLAVPTGARVTVHLVSIQTQEFRVTPVLPLQPPVPIGHEPDKFVFDQAYYTQDENYPATGAAVKLTAGWHDLGVASIHIYPVQVNPGRGTINVASRMVVRADFSGGAYPQTVTGWMVPMYSRLVANWPELNLPPARDDPDAHEYLAIVYDAWWYSDALNDMLAWIVQRGYRVEKVRVNLPLSMDTAYIKGLTREEYESHNHALRWVLLVGEPEQIAGVLYPNPLYPGPPGEGQYRFGDFPYSDFGDGQGNLDYFPEVGIGRICVNNMSTYDLNAIVAKTMDYQLNPKAPYDWLSRMVLVNNDGVPLGPCTYEAMVSVRNLTLNFYDFERQQIDGRSQSNGDVTGAVDAGAGSVLYFGHGGQNCWADWAAYGVSWTAAQINLLSNGPMTPVVVHLACNLGDIRYSSDCLTESWIRKQGGGAVAAMGSTDLMYGPSDQAPPILEQFVYAIGDNLHPVSGGGHVYPDPRINLGDIKMMMNARQATEGGTGDYAMILSYLLMGDPSMPMWTGGAPQRPLVEYPHWIPMTPSDVPVSVHVGGAPVCSALVCLYRNPDVYVAGRTNGQGTVTLTVPAHGPGDIAVTVTEGHANEDQQGVAHTPILPFTSGTWYECAQVPSDPSGKAVWCGGWLDFDAGGSDLIYAAKGNKVADFYRYDPAHDAWDRRTLIPAGTEYKPPSKGCRGVSDGNGHIYMTKGNNTQGFWRYYADGDSWQQKKDVPLGRTKKRVKGGTDMVYAADGCVYLLKGYRNEFWRYHPDGDSWHALADAPAGVSVKWDRGSWLAYDGEGTLYAHKARYHELYPYHLGTQSWGSELAGMPFVGGSGRTKKSRDGGCGAYLDGTIHALKGGNTQEFWCYNVAQNQWTEAETMPQRASYSTRKRKVSSGGEIANAGGTLFAFKGSKALEMWRCAPGIRTSVARDAGLAGCAVPTAPAGDGLDETPIAEGIAASRPCWNPSGAWVTYTKEPGQGSVVEQVFMAHHGLPQFEVQLTNLPGDCESPSFSPNGLWIGFATFDTCTNRMQIAKVPASTMPHPVTMLTFGNQDKWNPEWSPTGQFLVCQGDNASGSYSQLWLVPAGSGPATMLTSGPFDREEPAFLTPSTILYVRSPDDGDDQLCKLDLATMQETPLTAPPLVPEHPCPSWDGSFACYQAQDGAGTYQIGRVSSLAGDAHFLTGDVFDQEEPDASPDNVSIHSVRWVGLTSQVCRVDAVLGGFVPITDASAIRDNPDSYWNPNLPYNLVVYEREDTTATGLGFGPNPKPRKGTGVFLARSQRPLDGVAGAGLYPLALDRADPNPATNLVRIRWQVPVEADVSLRVYNAAGQLVKVLADGRTRPGAHVSVWNGTDTRGRRLANGVYFYALDNGARRISRKLVMTE